MTEKLKMLSALGQKVSLTNILKANELPPITQMGSTFPSM
jgi:hypothetical protein